jgi:cytochrome c biogenesis factor
MTRPWQLRAMCFLAAAIIGASFGYYDHGWGMSL